MGDAELDALYDKERETYNRFADMCGTAIDERCWVAPPITVCSYHGFYGLMRRFRVREHRLGEYYRARLVKSMRTIATYITDPNLKGCMLDVATAMEDIHRQLADREGKTPKHLHKESWSKAICAMDDPKYKGLNRYDMLEIAREALSMGV